MGNAERTDNAYPGFEQGPIRPPSEARSLLVRVTRNCPWNRCTFCPVYKGARFSRRPVEHVKRDIDLVFKHVEGLQSLADASGALDRERIREAVSRVAPEESVAFSAAYQWLFAGGMRSVFLQDADSLIIKPADLIDILLHLRARFPSIRRITSYARADTIARKTEDDLTAIRDAGLDRIHIGLESGCDRVLAMVQKGSTKERQIVAGQKAKRAGMELSEYVMPGLGGQELSEAHALETADALNQIDPDFIRLRTLAIPPHAPLFEAYRSGRFTKCTDALAVQELLRFIEALDGITSVIKSDHILNLFMELQGKLPRDKARMIETLRGFLSMDPADQRLFRVGRRLGVFTHKRDLQDMQRRAEVEQACRALGVTAENVDDVLDEITTRFV